MKDEIVHELTDRALIRFGEVRAADLAEDIQKLAADLDAIRHYPISIDDEP